MAIAPPIEIDLRAGITTNESLLAIGPRLWQSQNSVWDFRYPRTIGTAQGPWMHRQPLAFPNRSALAYTGAVAMRDFGFTNNPTALAALHRVVFGTNGSGEYSYWDADGGGELAFRAGVTRATLTSGPTTSSPQGSSVYFGTPGNDPNGGAALAAGVGAMVFAHPRANHVYYLLDNADPTLTTAGNGARSLTTDVTNCPAGAAALAIHLDRVWLLLGGFLYYTDPLNLDSIRTTNVVRVKGQGRCLVPGQYGAIDTSGVPHIISASATSVEVLDGDPQLGGGLQADLRTLSDTIGFGGPHAACVTPYGVFGLGTDGGLWLIPPGCQTMTELGGPIRDRLGINNKTQTVDLDDSAFGSLCWFDPYLYIFPGGETGHFYIAEPTPQGVKYWGPMIGSATYATGGRVAIIRAAPSTLPFSGNSPSGADVPSMHSISATPSAATARYLAFDTRAVPTGSYPNGTNLLRAPTVQTGLINVPGHRVRPIRVILETLRRPLLSSGDPPAHTVGITNEYGVNVAGVRQSAVAVTGTYLSTVVETAMYTFPDVGPTRAFSVVIVGTTESNLAIQRGTIEYEATKAVGQVTP
jgi:hypothetical protein